MNKTVFDELIEMFTSFESKLILGALATVSLILFAVYLVRLVRNHYQEPPDDAWASLKQAHEQGNLREYEYKHLKGIWAKELRSESLPSEQLLSQPPKASDFQEVDDGPQSLRPQSLSSETFKTGTNNPGTDSSGSTNPEDPTNSS